MHELCPSVRLPIRRTGRRLGLLSAMALGTVLGAGQSAHALLITPTFDASITGNGNAAQIEGAINSAIGTIDGLYSNVVTVPVTFTFNPAAAGNLLSTSQFFFDRTYANYVSLLTADSAAHPENTVLATALANLSKGNNSNGARDMAIAGNQLTMLGVAAAANAVVNINSNQMFAFARPVPSNQFDLIGGLEHELNEVLGGGGAGSTLNSIAGSCVANPGGFFCNKDGSLDLYRYSAPNTPSFSTAANVTSFLSVDGGVTNIVNFNQNSNGDFADFAPPGAGPGQLIQNAFNSTGQDEAYTNASPEFAMLEAIGWNPFAQVVTTPEPGTLALLGTSLLGLAALRRRRRQ
jgi:hypothetical protein